MFTRFRWTERKMHARMHGWTDGRTHTHTRTDGQPENIMPPAPVSGGGIKMSHYPTFDKTNFVVILSYHE